RTARAAPPPRTAHRGPARVGRHPQPADRHLSAAAARRMAHHRRHATAAVRPGAPAARAARPRRPGALRPGRRRALCAAARGATMTITVLKPGLLSTFQDLGRIGYQHLGVPVSGAMDGRAHRLANLLAGNPDHEATLEITL